VHPYQTEVFEVLEGTIVFKAGGEQIVAEAGDTVTVEPGTATSSGTPATPPHASAARCGRPCSSSA
jgi:uncharacterized cupin superfamily protein